MAKIARRGRRELLGYIVDDRDGPPVTRSEKPVIPGRLYLGRGDHQFRLLDADAIRRFHEIVTRQVELSAAPEWGGFTVPIDTNQSRVTLTQDPPRRRLRRGAEPNPQ